MSAKKILPWLLVALCMAGCSEYPLSQKGVYHTDKALTGFWVSSGWFQKDKGSVMIAAENRDEYSIFTCDRMGREPSKNTAFPTRIGDKTFLNVPVSDSGNPKATGYEIDEYILSPDGKRLTLIPLDTDKLPKSIHSSAQLYRYVKDHLPELLSKPVTELKRY